MKLQAAEMLLLELDYGDLVRPEFKITEGGGWGQCTNSTNESLIVYGPKHTSDRSICDTSPYLLPPGGTTPDHWDCDGFLLPADRTIRTWRKLRQGPLAIKFWDYRRFEVRSAGTPSYQTSWNNGVFEPSQINWAIPNFTYAQIRDRLQRTHPG